ncbi:MAG: respiratory nitrate reductase subunit gamma [Myxococcales bacterium]|nr:respiratory nitrate reductase subunit gamma [Myxococcales bacterium]
MLEAFLYVGFPYLALTLLVVGTAYRFLFRRYTVSSLSSQVLESRALAFGSVPWHLGILVVLAGHLLPFLAPGLWQSLVASAAALLVIEVVGMAAAILAFLGIVVLLARRVLVARLQGVTTAVDLVVLILLAAQVLLGILVAALYPWGAAWAPGTLMRYLHGLFTLSPDMLLVSEMPAAIKAHVVLAFGLFALVPFSRLVHAFVVPLEYLVRPFQRVIWTNVRRAERLSELPGGDPEEGRRGLVRGLAGVGGAMALMAIGVFDKLARFVKGDSMSKQEKETLLSHKLERLEQTAEQRSLELERMRTTLIPVAKLGDLKSASGKYFIDFEMRAALAFKDELGVPILISAKCTHLGCTVGSQVDDQGRILCPCHVSYFNVKTGQPNEGAPAKAPLPHLAWALRAPDGKVVASRAPGGEIQGTFNPELVDHDVCVTQASERGEA